MKPIRENRVSVGQILTFLFVGLLLLSVLKYSEFQARNLLTGPGITLIAEPDAVQYTDTVTLTGSTQNIVSLTLNGRQIYVDEKGYFTETLVLENGYTIMTLRAKDRFGRETNIERSFVQKKTLTDNS